MLKVGVQTRAMVLEGLTLKQLARKVSMATQTRNKSYFSNQPLLFISCTNQAQRCEFCSSADVLHEQVGADVDDIYHLNAVRDSASRANADDLTIMLHAGRISASLLKQQLGMPVLGRVANCQTLSRQPLMLRLQVPVEASASFRVFALQRE